MSRQSNVIAVQVDDVITVQLDDETKEAISRVLRQGAETDEFTVASLEDLRKQGPQMGGR